MTTETPQVTQEETVDNSGIVDAADAILAQSDSLHDWYAEQCRTENLA
ncbi:hypothetical protein AB4Y77_01865 [Paenarthrobacter sp. YAF11_1]